MKKPNRDWVWNAITALMVALALAWIGCEIYVAHHFITKYW